jgi:endonuclease-8
MSEGPQIKLITERLQRQLKGKVISHCKTTRANLEDFAASIVGRSFKRIFCKGKHIFFDFGSGQFLYNHMLMRGRWKISRDRFLLLSPEIWIVFEASDRTVYNYMGQVLKILDAEHTQAQLDSLGLDIMNKKCTRFDILEALLGQEKPIGELLLDQSVLCGIGNVAKSESLFLAGICPETLVRDLNENQLLKLASSIMCVMWDSYKCNGRWTHRVYRRTGNRCFECGNRISMIRQGKQNRSTYFCPSCQPKT